MHSLLALAREPRRPRIARLSVLLITVAVALSACAGTVGGGPGAAPGMGQQNGSPGEPGTTCGLVADWEIAELTGVPVEETRAGERDCTWVFAEGDTINLRVESTRDPDLQGPRTAFQGGEDVPGVADEAYWAPDVTILYFADQGATLAVHLLLISEDAPSISEQRAIAIEIARLAAGRH